MAGSGLHSRVMVRLPAMVPLTVIPAQAGIQGPRRLDPRLRGGDAEWRAAVHDALLPKLVSGELRIRDVERIIGRCA